jgi:hypothetical protein
MLAARRGGAWFLSTPTGTAHYFHTLFRKGQSGLLPGSEWRSWQMPTGTNPFIAAEEIESMRANSMSEMAFRQEIMAEFVTWSGAVFTRLRDAVSEERTGKAAVIGVDWAGASGGGDYTAFCVLSFEGHVLELVRVRGEAYMAQRARLEGLWEGHGRPPVLAEENGMGAVQNAELRQAGVPVQDWITSSASKTEIVSKLVQAFEQGNIRIPDDEVLLGELQAFQAVPLAGGQFRYSAPPGLHDDLVMSLAIAWAGLGKSRKREAAVNAFKNLGDVNLSMSTGMADGEGGVSERVRVLREKWRN